MIKSINEISSFYLWEMGTAICDIESVEVNFSKSHSFRLFEKIRYDQRSWCNIGRASDSIKESGVRAPLALHCLLEPATGLSIVLEVVALPRLSRIE